MLAFYPMGSFVLGLEGDTKRSIPYTLSSPVFLARVDDIRILIVFHVIMKNLLVPATQAK